MAIWHSRWRGYMAERVRSPVLATWSVEPRIRTVAVTGAVNPNAAATNSTAQTILIRLMLIWRTTLAWSPQCSCDGVLVQAHILTALRKTEAIPIRHAKEGK